MRKIIYFVFSFLVSIFLCNGVAHASESRQPLFIDNFTSINDSIWSINNFGGQVTISDGLNLISNNSQYFPYITSKSNIFPTSGDFYVEVQFQYPETTYFGEGFNFGNLVLEYGHPSYTYKLSDLYKLQVWQSITDNFVIQTFHCSSNESCDSSPTVVHRSTPNNAQHTFLLKNINGISEIFIDGTEIEANPIQNTNWRPTVFWIGNPYELSTNQNWTDIKIKKIETGTLVESNEIPKSIIIPGLGASWDMGAMLSGTDGNNWVIPDFVKNYQGLITSFGNDGYSTDNKNLFVFAYDWRKPLDTLADRLNTYIETNIPANQKINLVGHSMGGLVARAYAQKYGTNRINKIVTVGSPNMGTVKAYAPWEGAMIMDDTWWGKVALALTAHFGVIVGESNIQTVQRLVPSLKDLLPTYDFLSLNGNIRPWSSLNSKNDYLNNLNQNVASISALTTAIYSSGYQTNSIINVVTHSVGDLDTWIDGKPTDNPFVTTSGDTTVTDFSAKGPFMNTIQGSGLHGELVTKMDNIQKIFGVLGINQASVSAGVYDGDQQVFVAALRSPGKLEVCNVQVTQCNEQLGGYYYPDYKLFLLPNFHNEDLVVKVTDNGENGTYKLHLGDIGDVANWKVIEDGDLKEDGQVDFYNVHSSNQGVSAILDVAPKITVNSLITNDKTPRLTGNIDNNTATISIKIGALTFAATNKGDGTWELADNMISPALTDGTYDVIAKATDAVGNTGVDVTNNELTIDSVAPTATFRHFVDGIEFTGPIAYVKKLSQLSFSGNYTDPMPSSGLNQDSFVIFQSQNDHSFAFSNNGKIAYCSWRTGANTIPLSGTAATLEKIAFTKCIADLPEGEYYMSHQVYDNAIRQDIPSITQFRDVLGLHFVIDKTAPSTTVRGIDANWHKDPVSINFDCVDTGSGCNKTFYSVNGGPMTEGKSLVLSKEGQYTIGYYSVDLAGNTEVAKKTGIVKIDTTPPTTPKIILTFDLGQRIWAGWLPVKTADSYRIYYGSKANDLNKAIKIDDPLWISGVLPTGTYFVSVSAVDVAGNESARSDIVQIKVSRW